MNNTTPYQTSDPILLEVIQAANTEYDGRLTPPSGTQNECIKGPTGKVTRGEGAVAWNGDTAVGSVLFEMREQALYLGRLAVPRAYLRRGIGAQLVGYVEQQALVHGLKQITLAARLQLPENTAFYTRLGYHIVNYGSHPGFTEPTYMDMAMQLDNVAKCAG